MDIKVIGSGSSGNCYRITDGASVLLLDCGLPIARIKKALSYRLSEVDGVLVTHEHGDHIKAAKDMAKLGLDVYSTAGTFEAAGLSGHRYKAVKAGRQFAVGTFDILPFDTIHDAAEPVCYLIYSHLTGDKLLYLTDTGYCKYRFKGVTHLMIEVNHVTETMRSNKDNFPYVDRVWGNHMSLDTVLDFLAAMDKSRLRMVCAIHLSDNNSDEVRIRDKLQRAVGVPVIIA